MTVESLASEIEELAEKRSFRTGSLRSPTVASKLLDSITVHSIKNTFTPTSVDVAHHAVDGTTVTFGGEVSVYEQPRYCSVDDPRESIVVEMGNSLWAATEYDFRIDAKDRYSIEVTIAAAEKS